jgi:hypothetical protein
MKRLKLDVMFDRTKEQMKRFKLFKVLAVLVGEFRLWMCWFVVSILFIVLAVLFD